MITTYFAVKQLSTGWVKRKYHCFRRWQCLSLWEKRSNEELFESDAHCSSTLLYIFDYIFIFMYYTKYV